MLPNIDSVCIEALSVTINERGLEQATRSLGRLSSEVSRIKASDNQRLNQEYRNKCANRIKAHLFSEDTQEKQKYLELKEKQIKMNDTTNIGNIDAS